MVIVSCPHCYRANYIVVEELRNHEQLLECSKCGAVFLMRVKMRSRKSRKMDIECTAVPSLPGPVS